MSDVRGTLDLGVRLLLFPHLAPVCCCSPPELCPPQEQPVPLVKNEEFIAHLRELHTSDSGVALNTKLSDRGVQFSLALNKKYPKKYPLCTETGWVVVRGERFTEELLRHFYKNKLRYLKNGRPSRAKRTKQNIYA